MKKYKIPLIILACVFAALLIWNLTAPAQFHDQEFSFADSWRIRTLLMVKSTDFIEYGCGFSEDYAIQIGGLTYCLGQDDCGTVYIPELNFYYEMMGSREELHELLQKYN